MDIPTDRLLIMVIVATGFIVLIGGWAGGLASAEAAGLREVGWLAVLGVVFLAVLGGVWFRFRRVDEKSR